LQVRLPSAPSLVRNANKRNNFNFVALDTTQSLVAADQPIENSNSRNEQTQRTMAWKELLQALPSSAHAEQNKSPKNATDCQCIVGGVVHDTGRWSKSQSEWVQNSVQDQNRPGRTCMFAPTWDKMAYTCRSGQDLPVGNRRSSSETGYFGVLSGRFARARLDCMNLRRATNIFEL
jgi:hypothetical protein